MTTLGEEYPKQQARVRKLLEDYKALRGMEGVNPEFGIMMLEAGLKKADEAAADGDVVAMLEMFKWMEGCE